MEEKKSNASTRAKNKYAATAYDRIPIHRTVRHQQYGGEREGGTRKSSLQGRQALVRAQTNISVT